MTKSKFICCLVSIVVLICPACRKQHKAYNHKTNTSVRISDKDISGCVADVSGHCKVVDYKHLADKGVVGIYIKATEGSNGKGSKNPLYKKQYAAAKKVGLKVGAYHYLKASSAVTTQFENFKSVAPKEDMDLIPMLDIEDNFYKYWKDKSRTQDSIAKFIKLCKDYYGKVPIIYGTQRSYNTYCAPNFNNYHLMIGRYGNNSPQIVGRGRYTLWQFTDKYRTGEGHSGIDISRFNKGYTIKNIEL